MKHEIIRGDFPGFDHWKPDGLQAAVIEAASELGWKHVGIQERSYESYLHFENKEGVGRIIYLSPQMYIDVIPSKKKLMRVLTAS